MRRFTLLLLSAAALCGAAVAPTAARAETIGGATCQVVGASGRCLFTVTTARMTVNVRSFDGNYASANIYCGIGFADWMGGVVANPGSGNSASIRATGAQCQLELHSSNQATGQAAAVATPSAT